MELDYAASSSRRFLAAFPATVGAIVCQVEPGRKGRGNQKISQTRMRRLAHRNPQATARSRQTEPYKDVSRETLLIIQNHFHHLKHAFLI